LKKIALPDQYGSSFLFSFFARIAVGKAQHPYIGGGGLQLAFISAIPACFQLLLA
jgi:hypothetical protein